MKLDRNSKYNPFRGVSPTCGRLPGQVCADSHGKSLFGKPHRSRVKLDKEMVNAQRPDQAADRLP